MSRLWVELKSTGASWTQQVRCDFCGAFTLDRGAQCPTDEDFNSSTDTSGGSWFGPARPGAVMFDACTPCARVIEDVLRERCRATPVFRDVAVAPCPNCDGLSRTCPQCGGRRSTGELDDAQQDQPKRSLADVLLKGQPDIPDRIAPDDAPPQTSPDQPTNGHS